MSGQERTRPLQLTAGRFAPDRGTAPDGHPDKPTPTACDRLVSEVGLGYLSAQNTPSRDAVLVDVESDRQAEDAAVALASLYAGAQMPDSVATVTHSPSAHVFDNSVMADASPNQPVTAFWEGADELHRRREPARRQPEAEQSQTWHSVNPVLSAANSSSRGNMNPFAYQLSAVDTSGNGGLTPRSREKHSCIPDHSSQMPSSVESTGQQRQTVVPDGTGVASKQDTEILTQMMGQLSDSINKFGQMLASSSVPGRESESSESSNLNLSGRAETVVAQPGGNIGTCSSGSQQIVDSHSRQRNTVEDGNKKNHNIMKPQPFDGKEPVHSFLAHFQVCADFNRWDDADRKHWLQWCLKGRAQQMLWDLSTDQISTYASMVTALRERFGSDQQAEVYRIQLHTRRRRTNESLSELMQDIRRLMVLAYSSTTSSMWQAVAINAFLESLDDPVLALEVRKRGASTLDGAYRDALLLEGFLRASTSGPASCGKSGFKTSARATTATNSGAADNSKSNDGWRSELKEMQQKLQEQISRQGEQIQKLLDCQQPHNTGHTPEASVGRNTAARQEEYVDRSQIFQEKRCFNCGNGGHFARNCPYPPASQMPGPWTPTGPTNSTTSVPGQTSTRNRSVSSANTAYLPAVIDGKERWCLLDSGSQATIVPTRVAKGHPLIPSQKILTAANGTEIRISGETTLPLELGNLELPTTCLVSDFVDEIMLGLDWLEENDCVWNFGQRSITIKDATFQLYAHCPTWGVRRVLCSEPVTLYPKSQQDIRADVVFANLAPFVCDWATQASEPMTGVKVARALVDNQANQVLLRVANMNAKEVCLPKGMPLSRLEEVVVLPEQPTNSEAMSGDHGHLEEMVESIDPRVPADDVLKLRKLLRDNSGAFSAGEWDLGCTSEVKHRIDTGTNKPVRQGLRRQPLSVLQTIDEQLDSMQQAGVIEPVQSEWASNIVIVRKKDGSARFCVDYRGLNDRTAKDSYPLPRIDDCLDTLAGASWFSTFDLRSGYHQVAVDPADVHKTSFITRRGTFAFRVMPFGLCNAPATFQRLMDCVMKGLNYEVCLVYLDDIILFSATIDEHLARLSVLLGRLRKANLKLKPSKCHLLKRSVEFLGYIVSGEGISTDPKKTEAVRQWPVPRNIRDVRGFVGLCSYYRKFVPDLP